MATRQILVRAFEERDYPEYLRLLREARPETSHSEVELRHVDEAYGKNGVWRRFVVDEEGSLHAAASLATYDAGERQFRIDLIARPGADQLEHAHALYRILLRELRPHKPQALIARVSEDWPTWRSFYAEEGFDELERFWESRLDVEAFDPAAFRSTLDSIKRRGFTLTSLDAYEDNPRLQKRMYNTIVELLSDVPFSEPLNIWPFEVWQERYWNSPVRSPQWQFLVKHGDKIAGMSELRTTDRPDRLATGLTGVRRQFRRQGLALALKVHGIIRAKAQGVRAIKTQNHSINRPMLAINELLGFKKEPAWIMLRKPWEPP